MENLNWFEVINTGGTIAVLILNVWMFATGKIVPKSTVDMMLKVAEDRTTKLAEEIKTGIGNAVKDGIINGIHEVRNIQSG
jgi:hypothetical protein